ncbi:MAG: asparagine synthase C-terminal domain-containing protein, partial [Euryarchaeota archaeon]|nr:asparagine synthase C-terminal domain-containing protein [Euryarchaeota archaeon]
HRLLALLNAVINKLDCVPSGVAFSGGLDSSLLCGLITERTEKNYYTTGLPGSFDVKNAQHAARLLGIRLDVLEFSLTDIESVLPHVIATIENCDPIHVALSIPQHVITQRAATDGYKTVVTGQGADELFAGYRKYQTLSSAEPRDVNAALAADVHNIAANNLERDSLIAAANSVDLILPYLDPRVVSLGLSIDWTLKLKNGINKYVLRKAAKQVIPLELACKQKKAMQYGTGVAAALRRLARNFQSSKKNVGSSVSDYLRTVAEENNIRVAA